MKRANSFITFVVSFALIFSLLPAATMVRGQDMVASESISGGGSAFVFRGSKKAPQARMGIGYASTGEAAGGAGKARSGRTNAQIAAAAKKRKAAAALARKKAIIAAANKKLQLSNTLTAKGEKALDADQNDEAITNFRAALVQNPKNTRAMNGLSDGLTEKGIIVAGETNNAAAIPLFEEAIKYDKTNDVAFAKLGAVYDSSGDKAKAIANYEKAIAINPELAALQTTLGLAYVENGDIAKAEAALKKSEAGGSDSVDTRTLRGLILFKQNKNDEAIAAFDRVLELDNRNAAANYYRGQAFGRLDQNDKSIAAYKKAIEAEPGYAPASFDLGVAYYNAGDYKNAEIFYQSAVKSDPNNYLAHSNLASTYRQLERYPEANAEYAIASNGIKTADLYSEWGFCLGKTNEWDKAAARLQTARELSPTAIDNSNVGWAYYNSGTAKTANKDEAGAKADYALGKTFLQKAVEQDPKLDAAYLNLGSTHNGLGEYQLAVNVLNTAVGLRKGWTLAMNQLGLGYRGLNDLTNAVAIFKQVTDLDGNNLFGLFGLGEAYNASGNKKEAKKINDRLKKLDPRLAGMLNDVFNGKLSMPGLGSVGVPNITNIPKVPKVPNIPKFPY